MKWHAFLSAEEQALSLATTVGDDLTSLLLQKDVVTLCVPGGTTPLLFLSLLSKVSLDWSRVKVLLNDERYVPLSDRLSNEAMLRDVFLRNEAVDAQIVSLFREGMPIENFVKNFNHSVDTYLPLDICILGMGADGHTASLFPDMLFLEDALDETGPAGLIIANAPNKPEQRVSLNLSALLSAQQHYVLIKGVEKKEIIQKANQTRSFDLPISYVLAATSPATFYTD